MLFDLPIIYGALLALLLFLLFSMVRILREYERGVVFMLGRFWRVKGPGLVILIPGIQQMVRVDLRVVTMDVPTARRDFTRQCFSQGQCSRLFPRR